ncbi:MAG: hypothetical protein HC945_02980 [Nitrosarchaeum sp.]|nr:hypothetical protein [Nitrosarchaeum sp.]
MRLHHPKGSIIQHWPRTLQIKYDPSEWEMDEKGYFLIEVDHKGRRLLVGFLSTSGEPIWKVAGDHPIPLYYTIIKEGAISRMEHACYLGEELEKAYLALKYGLRYVQDEEIDFARKHVPSEKDDPLGSL